MQNVSIFLPMHHLTCWLFHIVIWDCAEQVHHKRNSCKYVSLLLHTQFAICRAIISIILVLHSLLQRHYWGITLLNSLALRSNDEAGGSSLKSYINPISVHVASLSLSGERYYDFNTTSIGELILGRRIMLIQGRYSKEQNSVAFWHRQGKQCGLPDNNHFPAKNQIPP